MNHKLLIYVLALVIAIITIPVLVVPMTPNSVFSISSSNEKIIYEDDKGNVILTGWYFTPKGGNPGDTITVKGYIYNGRSEPIKLYAETGIAPHGWKSFSVFGTPVKAPIEGGPCCPDNKNYDGGYFTIQPHQYVYVELHPELPTSSSVDHCHNLGSFWDGINKDYDIAFIVIKPVNGDACYVSPSQHGQTLYTSRSIVYMGNGGVNLSGYYLDTSKLLVLTLFLVGLFASAYILLMPRKVIK